MKKYRDEYIYKFYLKFLFLFIISLYCSGCATLILQTEYKPEGNSSNEIGRKSAALESKYCGQEIFNNKPYNRYIITGTRVSCKYDSAIDMLLPVNTEKDSKAILRESNLKKTCVEQPAQIYYMYIPNKDALETDPIKYPKKIFIFPPGQFEGDEMKIRYQDTAEGQNARFIDVAVDSSDLKWICRDKGKYTTYCVLLPFAVVYDALTWPFQLIFAAFTYHGP